MLTNTAPPPNTSQNAKKHTINRLAEEEEARRQAAEAKQQREADKKALKRERQRMRALVRAHGEAPLLDEDDTEKLCQSLDTAALAALSDAAGAEGLSVEQRRAVLRAKLEEMAAADAAAAEERERQKQEAAAAMRVRGGCGWGWWVA